MVHPHFKWETYALNGTPTLKMRYLHPKQSAWTQDRPLTHPKWCTNTLNKAPAHEMGYPHPKWCTNTPNKAPTLTMGHMPQTAHPAPQMRSLPPTWATSTPNEAPALKTGYAHPKW
ncbi:hypothetical protein BS17DRAFT_766833 [Gyrodon lividus]|nr:hypothetical protein BS17DRAFT_766833 [Gyrodon lividus]